LDMGDRPSVVGAGSPVPYVPSAALLLRRAAAPDGFDPALEVGEDVDLVWRLSDAGWRVLYDPRATVRHEHRTALPAFARRRLTYARSIALLARRPPGALPAVWVEPWSASALAALGSVRIDGVLTAATTAATRTAMLR